MNSNKSKISCKQGFTRHAIKNKVILNLIQDLQRLLWLFINGMRGRYPAGRPFKYGMTANLMGFSLIELLVVVLIIGILAAVAVPQYQKAVERSRVVSLLSVIKPIKDAEEIYYLNHGQYTDNIEELDVDAPAGASPVSVGSKKYNLPNGQLLTLSEANDSHRIIVGGTEHVQIDAVLKNSSWASFPAGNIYCGALPSDQIGLQVCKSFGSTKKATLYSVGCGMLASPPANCEWYRIAL